MRNAIHSYDLSCLGSQRQARTAFPAPGQIPHKVRILKTFHAPSFFFITLLKKLTLAISILLLALYSYAQGISAGVKAGLNISNQNVSWDGSSINTNAKVGIHLGGYAVVMLIENFGIQPEILFSNCMLATSYSTKRNN